MSETWAVQVSVKTPAGTLVNLRGERGTEVEAQLSWLIENAGHIVKAEQAFSGVANVAGALGGQVVQQQSQPWSQQGSQQSPAFAQPQQQAAPAAEELIPPQTCVHGAMTLRRAKPESGKKWVAYMCPTPQGTPGQCSPIDAKTGKSWKS